MVGKGSGGCCWGYHPGLNNPRFASFPLEPRNASPLLILRACASKTHHISNTLMIREGRSFSTLIHFLGLQRETKVKLKPVLRPISCFDKTSWWAPNDQGRVANRSEPISFLLPQGTCCAHCTRSTAPFFGLFEREAKRKAEMFLGS